MRNLILRAVFLVLPLLLASCNYRLAGTPQPLPFKTIAVEQVVNDSYAPQASNPLMNQLTAMLAQSPALELVPLDDAQAVLEVTLDDYTKTVLATSERDTALARSIGITLKAKCTLKDARSGRTLFKDREVSVTNTVYSNDGFLNAEYQNMTILTRELARRIADQVLGIW